MHTSALFINSTISFYTNLAGQIRPTLKVLFLNCGRLSSLATVAGH